MIPRSLSASSLKNWIDCPACFVATNVDYVPDPRGGNDRARVGTACHHALQHLVDAVYLKKTAAWSDTELLKRLYDEGFKETFGFFDTANEHYKDGWSLVTKWHARTDLSKWVVLAVEEKKRWPIRGFEQQGTVFTYIFDRISARVTEDGRKILLVTDYKSIVDFPRFEDLEVHLQLRLYGLMAAIEYRDWGPDEIHVELDLLRHDTTRGIEIKRYENEETWEFLVQTLQMILATDPEQAERRLGPACRYCPVSTSCPEVAKQIDIGGAHGWDLGTLLRRHSEMTGQQKALKSALEQIEALVEAEAKAADTKTLVAADGWKASYTQRTQRDVRNPVTAAEIIGPELMAKIGKFNITDLDKLLDSELLTEEQKRELRALIVKKPTRKSLKITPPNPLERNGK